MGEHDKALADVQRALAAFGKGASVLNLRATIHEAMGRRDDAVADFRAALAGNPGPQESAESVAGLKRLGVEP